MYDNEYRNKENSINQELQDFLIPFSKMDLLYQFYILELSYWFEASFLPKFYGFESSKMK